MNVGTSDNDSRGEAAPAPAELGQDQKLRVWDFPTRLFHWSVVSLVVVAWLIVGDEGWKLTVHTVAGYGLLVAIVFRLGWGVVGSTHARFADFVRPWSVVREYTRQLARRAPPNYIGHNPLGGWSVVLLLMALATIITTGLIAGDRGGDPLGPLAHLVSVDIARIAKEVHESTWSILQLLILVHLGGVFTHWALKGENLVRSMWTGDKDVTDGAVGEAGMIAPAWRAVLTVGVAAGLVLLVVYLP